MAFEMVVLQIVLRLVKAIIDLQKDPAIVSMLRKALPELVRFQKC
jgi:hypothetical protein